MNWQPFIDRLQSKLLSRRIKEPWGSGLRFMILGNIGSFVQTGFFLLVMLALGQPEKNTALYFVAFVAGFVMEMIPNYFASCCYTFGQSPTPRNAGGFVFARAVNLVIQLVVLPLVTAWLKGLNVGLVSLIVIFLAGIINFLMQSIFFKPNKQADDL